MRNRSIIGVLGDVTLRVEVPQRPIVCVERLLLPIRHGLDIAQCVIVAILNGFSAHDDPRPIRYGTERSAIEACEATLSFGMPSQMDDRPSLTQIRVSLMI